MNVEKLQQVLTEALTKEWEAQGHSMTGKMVQTIDYVVKEEVDRLTLSGMIYPYGNILAAGTKANRIPYSGRTGKGGTSKYIQALQNYVQMRMNITDHKQSLRVAFAIATEQKKHGMPTPGSYSYTQTGKRTEWVGEAFKNNEDKITETVREMVYDLLLVNFDTLIDKWNILLNSN